MIMGKMPKIKIYCDDIITNDPLILKEVI